ncbi:MAG: cupredoxin domain-containing protein [Thaumarchaeota archaeon]|nr:cupredoxin domain-containing protein [Nitrososphaerota archaeon]
MGIGKKVHRVWQRREEALTRIIVAVIIIVVIIAVAVAIYFVAIAPRSGKSPSTAQVTIPSGADTQPSNWNQSHIISNNYFSPDMVVVVIGVNNTVMWTNRDDVSHTVTSFSVPSGATSFDSGPFGSGSTFSHTFQTPGVYEYFCSIHPWMGGEVIVKSS